MAEYKREVENGQQPVKAAQGQQKDEPFAEGGEFTESNWTEVCKSFDEMQLKDELLRGIYSKGWEKPSYIQEKGIIPLVRGRDTVAQANSGTGKTGTFLIGSVQRIDEGQKRLQVLILSPTRELANQTHNELGDLTQWTSTTSHLCVGGTRVRKDIEALQRGVQIVIGTPGRCIDMVNRGVMCLSGLKIFCLDEADQMLERGFKEQMYDLFPYLPQDVQVCLFSATMNRDVLHIARQIMRDPVRILVKEESVPLEGIQQFYIDCELDRYKMEVICDLYACWSISQAIIFCNTRNRAIRLAELMKSQDYVVSLIHGGLEQEERNTILKQFRNGGARVLIATDLLARGIDVADLSLVINYDVTTDKSNHIHRIGRSGRMGKKGVAINLIAGEKEKSMLCELQRFYSTQIDELPQDFTL